MWYNNIPHVQINEFLLLVLGLFSRTLDTLLGFEVTRFFLVLALFLIVFGLFVWMVREGRKGRL